MAVNFLSNFLLLYRIVINTLIHSKKTMIFAKYKVSILISLLFIIVMEIESYDSSEELDKFSSDDCEKEQSNGVDD